MSTLKKSALLLMNLILILGCSSTIKKITTRETDVNYLLTETYWKLVELNGQAIIPVKKGKEAFIIFKKDGNKVHGNSGCNTFNGTYTLNNDTQLSFSKMASTRMACMDMQVEKEILDALQNTNNIAIKGNLLSLNRARMAPLVKFEAVYVK